MNTSTYRQAITDYIRANANPPDKFSHQPRLYALARQLAEEQPFDDEVLFAAVWMHDLGVFIGHRPEDPTALAGWDNVAYARSETLGLLRQFGFPPEKIPAVVEVIRTHLPSSTPTSFEGALMRDADILEQLGAVGILRAVSKVGRDTRFIRFGEALTVLRQNLEQLPAQLRLASARRLAEPRIQLLKAFLEAAEAEAGGTEW
ncbi:MAG: phosphohydrolase [Verrucomicrobiae bacterium]|nr:phosphohydrolase [Verrucomicrobiae bacterium]